jgi:hypothetical protein
MIDLPIPGTPPGTSILSGIVILAATASVVAASVTRQENLSSRTRSLTHEMREMAVLAAKGNTLTQVERRRLKELPDQIDLFGDRLHYCVWGHIYLYLALAAETIGFGIGIFVALLRELVASDQGFSTIARLAVFIASPAFVVAMLFLFIGLGCHIKEYSFSNRTIALETSDIDDYKKEIRQGLDNFLKRLSSRSDAPNNPSDFQ